MHHRHILYHALLCILVTMAGLLFLHPDCQSQETPAAEQARPANAGRPNPMTHEDAQRGMTQFQQNCAMCHGSVGRGTGSGPSLIDSSLVRHDEHGNLITRVVQEGRSDRGMPAFPNLSANQIADIVAYLHARLVVSDSVSAVGPAAGYSLKRLLTGNAAAGKQYFDRNCTSCHAARGDLAGVAKKYPPADLEARMLYPHLTDQTGTVSLPSGETVKGRILQADAFDIALVDAQGNYHSWPLRPGIKVEIDDPLQRHLELLKTYTDKEIHDVFAYLETLQ